MKKPMFLTPELLDQCLGIVGPALTENFITSVPGRVVACIQVLNPLYENEPIPLWTGILGEKDLEKWPHDYNKFVFAKACAAFRTKLSGHVLNSTAPHLLTEDDFKFAGGVYYNGIVVATSGLASWEDDLLVSNMFAGMIEALVIKAANKKLAEKILFLGDKPVE